MVNSFKSFKRTTPELSFTLENNFWGWENEEVKTVRTWTTYCWVSLTYVARKIFNSWIHLANNFRAFHVSDRNAHVGLRICEIRRSCEAMSKSYTRSCKQKVQPQWRNHGCDEFQQKERAEWDLRIEGFGNLCSHFFKLELGHAPNSAQYHLK